MTANTSIKNNKKKLNSSLVIYLPIFLFSILNIIYMGMGIEPNGIGVNLHDSMLSGGVFKVVLLLVFILSIVYYKNIGMYFYNSFIEIEDSIFKVKEHYNLFKQKITDKIKVMQIRVVTLQCNIKGKGLKYYIELNKDKESKLDFRYFVVYLTSEDYNNRLLVK